MCIIASIVQPFSGYLEQPAYTLQTTLVTGGFTLQRGEQFTSIYYPNPIVWSCVWQSVHETGYGRLDCRRLQISIRIC